MPSVYRVGKSLTSSSYIEVEFEIKNGKPHWFVTCRRHSDNYQLTWHSFPIFISHLYVFWGLSKMINRDFEETYSCVKNHLHLISGKDIIAEQYLINKENSKK